MLGNAELAMRLLGSDDIDTVAADPNKLAALCYFLQTVGEAASRVSAECRSALNEIPWPKIIGMRHRLVHGYRRVAVHLVVGTVRSDLPKLALSLRRALESNSP